MNGYHGSKSHRRSFSAPELGAFLIHLSPKRLHLLLYTTYFRLAGFIQRAARWKGWRPLLANCAKGVLIAVHLMLVCLLCKCVLWPTDDPREEWWPSSWGVPWTPTSHSWAAVAAERKAILEKLEIEARLNATTARGPAWRYHRAPPPRLKYPVLWAAPFFSRSGYGTEAISYVAGMIESGLIAPEDLWITQAGDCRHPDALDGLDPAIRQLLWDQEWHNITKRLQPHDRDRPLIVICHVFPDCWRTAKDDVPSRWAIVRLVKWLVEEVKVRVYGIDRTRENGCPCPNQYIKDRVVYRVGRSMFETEKLPAPLVEYAAQLDEVLVPSQFSVDSFAASGIPASKLRILPQGINTTLFNPTKYMPINLGNLEGAQVTGKPHSYSIYHHRTRKPAAPRSNVILNAISKALGASALSGAQDQLRQLDDFVTTSYHHSLAGEVHSHHHWWAVKDQPFRFLSVFKWETRKGWDLLLRGFFQEFKADENVELHVVTHAFGSQVDDFRAFMRKQIKALMNVSDEDLDLRMPRVYVYDKYIPDYMYPGLYQAMDALVVPTHGEGWGRPQFEAMAMGLPVISTNWSGLTAFMDEKTSYPIRVEAVVEVNDPSPDAFFWFKGQKWAQPSLSHMQQLMRQVMTHRFDALTRGQAAKHRIEAEYSIPAVARKALDEIIHIQKEVDILLGDVLTAGSKPGGIGAPMHTVRLANS